MNYLNYVAGKSPNCDESEGAKKIVSEKEDEDRREDRRDVSSSLREEVPFISQCKGNQNPLRDKEVVKTPPPDSNPAMMIQSTSRGLAAMTVLAQDGNDSKQGGIVFKSHNLSFDSLTHKIPANLMSKPRCFPPSAEKNKMKIRPCREQFSGPICASRTLRKGGYV